MRARSAAWKTRIILAVPLGAVGLVLTAAGIPGGLPGLFMITAGGTIFFLGFLVIGPLLAGPLAAGLGWLPVASVRRADASGDSRRAP